MDLVVEGGAVDHAPRGVLTFGEVVFLPVGDVDEAAAVLSVNFNQQVGSKQAHFILPRRLSR